MGPFVFLSYSSPVSSRQSRLVARLARYIRSRGLEPRTLGVTDYDSDGPLQAVRRVLVETNGLVTVAFRRIRVDRADPEGRPEDLERMADTAASWTTSPYCHVEASMAFQLGIPVLALRENGVIEDGVLRPGVIGPYLPPIDLSERISTYLGSVAWQQAVLQWEHRVRSVIEGKGHPPRLY